MKLSSEQVAANRERVLDTALQLFRERGFDGVSVADLMRAAGLTHGGFYNHFDSKAELEAHACRRAFESSVSALPDPNATKADLGYGLVGYVSRYLSRTWRDAPAGYCPMVAFGSDATRGSDEAAAAFAEGLEPYLARLAGSCGENQDEARKRAITLAATLTGALALARAVRREKPALSDEILTSVREQLVADLLAED